MTYTTTHLGIASFVFYYFSPERTRAFFKNHPKTFFLLTLGTIMPDLDLLTSGHRAYGHSVFFPLILLVLSAYLPRMGVNSEDTIIKLRYFALFWLAHLIYDTTFGPVAYFWPLDNRFYDVNMGVRFDLRGNGILPITIAGLFVDVKVIDQSTGVRTFFVNWTPEQRIASFGSEITNYSIMDFMVHATLFIWYLLIVVYPVLKILILSLSSSIASHLQIIQSLTRKISDGTTSGKQVLSNLSSYQGNLMTILFLVLLGSSFFVAGPYYHKQWVDTDKSSSQYYILSNNVRLIGTREYTVPANSEFTLKVNAGQDSLNYSLFAVLVNRNIANEIKTNVTRQLDAFDAGNLTFTEFVIHYQSYIASQEIISADNIKFISNDTSADWSFASFDDKVILNGLYSWNSSLSFVMSFNYHAEWLIDRTTEYRNGLILMILVMSVAVLETARLMYTIRKNH